uniref:Sinhcafl antisense lncRNA n=1 Tax=Salmo trutta TaxID=8032 RepID=A0A673Z0C0_SALTR
MKDVAFAKPSPPVHALLTAADMKKPSGYVLVLNTTHLFLAGPGFKLTKPKKMKNSDGKKKNKLKRLHKFKRQNSDAHSTTSSMSPSQSPSYESDDGSDIESKQRRPTPSVFSFLDRSYWKRQKVCCGIVYKGRFGEVMIDPRLFKPCCSSKKQETLVPMQDTHLPLPTIHPPPLLLPEALKEDW